MRSHTTCSGCVGFDRLRVGASRLDSYNFHSRLVGDYFHQFPLVYSLPPQQSYQMGTETGSEPKSAVGSVANSCMYCASAALLLMSHREPTCRKDKPRATHVSLS